MARHSAAHIIAKLEERDSDMVLLVKRVAEAHDVSEEQLLEADKRTLPTHARHVLWTMLVEEHELTLTTVAKIFGVDHTAVHYAIRRIRAEREGAAA